MAERELITLEAQFVLVAADVGRIVTGTASHCVAAGGSLAVEGTQLAVVVLIDLTATLEVQREVMIIVWSQCQAGTDVVVTSLNGGCAAFADGGIIVEGQIRLFPIIETSANRQAEQSFSERAAGIHAGAAGVAVIAVLLKGVVQSDRSAPLVRDFLGDDI